MRAGRRMVRGNGQRDGVGKTRQLSGAFEHTGAILDLTRVSPYRPAAGDMPQSMRPDTRQHLTACTRSSEEMELPETKGERLRTWPKALAALGSVYLAHGRPRLSSRCAAPPLRYGPAGDCRGRPCGKPLRASRKAGPAFNRSKSGATGAAPLSRRTDPATRERRAQNRGDSKKACNLRGVHTRQLPGGVRTR